MRNKKEAIHRYDGPVYAAIAIALPMLLAAVFATAAVGSLRHPDTLENWAQLGVPRMFRHRIALALHPWAELALALGLVVIGGVLGLIVGGIALVVMATYLTLIVRAYRAHSDATCACFGQQQTLTRRTIVRNSWYVLLAAANLAVAMQHPALGGPLHTLATSAPHLWAVPVLLVLAAVTVVLTVDSSEGGGAASETATSADPTTQPELDYIRTRTPAVPVTLADGTIVNLRDLTRHAPLILIAVNPGCRACTAVLQALPQWRARLPEVPIRLLLTASPEASASTEHAEPQSVHDTHRYVRDSIAEWSTPTAVLFGADGMLAGGPVSGEVAISRFIDDIYASLHEGDEGGVADVTDPTSAIPATE
ncbi:MauE/DoxX family redox-associated membrane protein [Microbacterium sp. YY-01]|uniref:MauE/DoxX family redox-associated membrane protein n=1 Tax=Microbacterium sp. YY-01 TaxID=3421634 RepID=UPI003D165E39